MIKKKRKMTLDCLAMTMCGHIFDPSILNEKDIRYLCYTLKKRLIHLSKEEDWAC